MPTVRLHIIWLLLKKQLLELLKFYLLAPVVAFVLACIFNMVFFYFVDNINQFKYGMFSALLNNLGFIVATTVITAASFYEMHHPKNIIGYLQLPASAMEKVLSNIVIAFVIMPLVLAAVFYGASAIFTTVYNNIHLPRYGATQIIPGFLFGTLFTPWDYLLTLLFLNGIYLAGAARFKKLSWISTTVIAGIFITVLLCANILPAINGRLVALPSLLALSRNTIAEGLAQQDEQFSKGAYQFLLAFRWFLWATPLLFIAAAWYRLKERNV